MDQRPRTLPASGKGSVAHATSAHRLGWFPLSCLTFPSYSKHSAYHCLRSSCYPVHHPAPADPGHSSQPVTRFHYHFPPVPVLVVGYARFPVLEVRLAADVTLLGKHNRKQTKRCHAASPKHEHRRSKLIAEMIDGPIAVAGGNKAAAASAVDTARTHTMSPTTPVRRERAVSDPDTRTRLARCRSRDEYWPRPECAAVEDMDVRTMLVVGEER